MVRAGSLERSPSGLVVIGETARSEGLMLTLGSPELQWKFEGNDRRINMKPGGKQLLMILCVLLCIANGHFTSLYTIYQATRSL